MPGAHLCCTLDVNNRHVTSIEHVNVSFTMGGDGRSPPGTLKEGLSEQLGLVPKEVTIVMTDVQGSSRLWEWCVLIVCIPVIVCL